MDNLTAKNNLTAAAAAVIEVLKRSGEVPPLRSLYFPRYLREIIPEVVRGPAQEHYIKVTVPKRGYNTYKRRGPKNWAIPSECDVKQLEAVFTLFLPTPFRCVAVRNAPENVAIFITIL